MKNAIILHGMPSRDGYEADIELQGSKHWMGWLTTELDVRGMVVHAPELPEPWDPDYSVVKSICAIGTR